MRIECLMLLLLFNLSCSKVIEKDIDWDNLKMDDKVSFFDFNHKKDTLLYFPEIGETNFKLFKTDLPNNYDIIFVNGFFYVLNYHFQSRIFYLSKFDSNWKLEFNKEYKTISKPKNIWRFDLNIFMSHIGDNILIKTEETCGMGFFVINMKDGSIQSKKAEEQDCKSW